MQTTLNKEVIELTSHGREDYNWFLTHALDVKEEHLWSAPRKINDSVRDNERTAVKAGHGVSKTWVSARLALAFLYCHYPSTVITTAPSWDQVKNETWREIRECHTASRIPLGGKLLTTTLDLQYETGVKWFATGIATKPDTVTQEATRLQGHHNVHMLIIIEEAAGVRPEIWKAIQHIGAPFKRVLAIGNATVSGGEFAACFKDQTWHHITVSVLDTPNFKTGKKLIPGVYGREYEREIRLRYGVDSDEYRVRVLGGISQKAAEGAYYGRVMGELWSQGRISDEVTHNPNYAVHIVEDVGYTTAMWLFQIVGTEPHFIRYYEDQGRGVEDYCRLFREWQVQYDYHYGKVFVPCDMDSNATKVVTGQTALDTLQALMYEAEPLPREWRVTDGILRTTKFLQNARFNKTDCAVGIDRLEQYHERKNMQMSTEDNPVFTGIPEKDGTEHGADAMRYASLACEKCDTSGSMTAVQVKALHERHRRP